MPRGEVWTERTVAWYERANEQSDYAERVLEAGADLVAACRTALDVGAGFGALALPLARRGIGVTALEPARFMAAALRRAVAREQLANVEVIEAPWGERPLAPHDLVVCAHVGPLLNRGSTFLGDIRALARRGILVVRDAEGGDDKFFFSELYPLLLDRSYGRSSHDVETLDVLHELGIAPVVTSIEYRSDQPFDSLDEACEFWMTYMGLEDEKARAFLARFLAERLERRNGGWVARYRKRATVMHWRV